MVVITSCDCLFSDYEDMNRRELLAAVIDLQRVSCNCNFHLCATSYKGNHLLHLLVGLSLISQKCQMFRRAKEIATLTL